MLVYCDESRLSIDGCLCICRGSTQSWETAILRAVEPSLGPPTLVQSHKKRNLDDQLLDQVHERLVASEMTPWATRYCRAEGNCSCDSVPVRSLFDTPPSLSLSLSLSHCPGSAHYTKAGDCRGLQSPFPLSKNMERLVKIRGLFLLHTHS